MTINLITFASLLHKQASALNSHEVILNELEKYFTVRFVNYEDIDKLSNDDFKIIFIATGGVDIILNLSPALPSFWQTACKTHSQQRLKYLPGSVTGV